MHCPHCGRVFKAKHLYTIHLYSHEQLIKNAGGFNCSACERHFVFSHELEEHMGSLEHKMRRLECKSKLHNRTLPDTSCSDSTVANIESIDDSSSSSDDNEEEFDMNNDISERFQYNSFSNIQCSRTTFE